MIKANKAVGEPDENSHVPEVLMIFSVLSDGEKTCLQSLCKSDYYKQKQRNPQRATGTCMWFLDHPHYREWTEKQSSSLLWVSGDPGCGKSVLSSFLVDEFVEELRSSETASQSLVCYFFCKDDNDEQKSGTLVLSAILHQLLKYRPELIDYAMPEFHSKGKKFTEEFATLWGIFITSVENSGLETVACIIDGLDECEETTRGLLISSLTSYYSSSRAGIQCQTSLKFIVTSRPLPSIENGFFEVRTVRLKAEDETRAITGDITLAIRERLDKLQSVRRISGTIRKKLENHLICNADRTFLWASLTIEMLEKSTKASESAFDEILENLPKSLDAMYEKILNQTPDQDEAILILQIIIAAFRPLTLDEINVAMSIRERHGTLKDLERDLEPCVERTLRNLCGLFIRAIGSKVYLVHQTGKEFLSGALHNTSPSQQVWKHCLSIVHADLVLCQRCIWYISLKDFEELTEEDFEKKLSTLRDSFPFLNYATKHWIFHFDETGLEYRDLCTKILQICYTPSKRVLWTALDCHNYIIGLRYYLKSGNWRQNSSAALTVGSYLGSRSLVRLALNKEYIQITTNQGSISVVSTPLSVGESVDMLCGDYRLALLAAIDSGHADVFELLLQHGLKVNDTSGRLDLRLLRATEKSDTTLLQLLLDQEVEINMRDQDRDSLLEIAIGKGHADVVKLLLQHGPNVNDTNGKEDPPLLRATGKSDLYVMQSLLDLGANVNIRSYRHEAVLQIAIDKDYLDGVQLLLRHGANANDTGALLRATEQSNAAVLQLLLDYGADASMKNQEYNSALQLATKNGSAQTIQLLLDYGADANVRIGVAIPPLILGVRLAALRLQAAPTWMLLHDPSEFPDFHLNLSAKEKSLWIEIRSRAKLVQTLQKNAIQIESQEGAKDLRLATHEQYLDSIEVLLKSGADTEVLENGDVTALQIAASTDDWKMVQLLIKYRANCNVNVGTYSRLLHHFAAAGNIEIVQLLLEREVYIRDHGSEYRTALQAPAERNRWDMVLLLLEHARDCKAQIGLDGSLLKLAAAHGGMECVQLLLEVGVDGSSDLSWLDTALNYAAEKGRPEAVELILAKGANFNARAGKRDGTVLHSVAESSDGAETIVKAQMVFEAGSDASVVDRNHNTALHVAASAGHSKVVKLLIDKGADIDATNNRQNTALHEAAYSGHLMTVRVLLDGRADVTIINDRQNTALHEAVYSGCPSVLELLINKGADINAVSEMEGSPLIVAAYEGQEEIAQLLRSRGADFKSSCGNFGTPLQAARKAGNQRVVQLLLDGGADPEYGKKELERIRKNLGCRSQRPTRT